MPTARTTKRATAALAAESATIILPAVSAYRRWSPALLRSAESAADSGNIRTAVDIVDWILGDDKVRGAIDGRLNGVFGQPLTFDASGDRRRRNRAVRALEVGEDWDAMFAEPEAWQVNAWAILLGLGTGVLRWEMPDGHEGRDIPRLEFYHPQPLRYDWSARTWLARGMGGAGADTPIAFGDGVWLGHMPFGTFRPWSAGLWRAIAPWVLLKQYARSDFGRLGEGASREVIEIDKDSKSTKELRSELASALTEAGREGKIVLPPGFTYKLAEMSAATADIYAKQINMADTAIAVAIRGGNLTTGSGDKGARSLGEVHERGDLANARRDASAWGTTTHDQALAYWSEANFGDAQLAPWPVYSTDPEEDRKAKADVLTMATTGAAQAEALGFELDRKAFIEEFEFNFLKPGAKPEPKTEAPAVPDAPAVPTPDAPSNDAPGAGAAMAIAGAMMALTSGQENGQDYADRVRASMTAHAARELAPTVAAMISAIRNAGSYDEARQMVESKYSKLASPSELSSLTEAALIMVQLGGRLSVDEEA